MQFAPFRGLPRVVLPFLALCLALLSPAGLAQTNRYQFEEHHDPNGTGKFYLGREIALVMGHEAADWLERPERNQEENTDLLLKKLPVKPGDVVADIGAGTGYLSRRLARKVGPHGKVIAQDVQPEMLALVLTNSAGAGISNISTVLGSSSDPKLPSGTLDAAILVDVYHEFDHPFEMMQGICLALKPGGRVIFVEFRGEDPSVPIKKLHKMTLPQVKKEMSVQPLRFIQSIEDLPWQHVIIFEKE
jgi:precorrin-6B methylase 2